MKSIWTVTYDNNDIRVVNSWFEGEQLFVNDVLQDKQVNMFSANLTGHLTDDKGNKLKIKANLGGFLKINCHLFIDDNLVEVNQIK